MIALNSNGLTSPLLVMGVNDVPPVVLWRTPVPNTAARMFMLLAGLTNRPSTSMPFSAAMGEKLTPPLVLFAAPLPPKTYTVVGLLGS